MATNKLTVSININVRRLALGLQAAVNAVPAASASVRDFQNTVRALSQAGRRAGNAGRSIEERMRGQMRIESDNHGGLTIPTGFSIGGVLPLPSRGPSEFPRLPYVVTGRRDHDMDYQFNSAVPEHIPYVAPPQSEVINPGVPTATTMTIDYARHAFHECVRDWIQKWRDYGRINVYEEVKPRIRKVRFRKE